MGDDTCRTPDCDEPVYVRNAGRTELCGLCQTCYMRVYMRGYYRERGPQGQWVCPDCGATSPRISSGQGARRCTECHLAAHEAEKAQREALRRAREEEREARRAAQREARAARQAAREQERAQAIATKRYRDCEQCGKPAEQPRRSRRRYCSSECRHLAYVATHPAQVGMAEDDPHHGARTGYNKLGCRCGLCRRWAYQDQQRKYQEGGLARQHARGKPCRGCGAMRVSGKDRPAPLCHECQRAARAQRVEAETARRAHLAEIEAALRAAYPDHPPLAMGRSRAQTPKLWIPYVPDMVINLWATMHTPA